MDIRKRNNIHVTGTGPVTLLFSHGFGCDQTMWRHLVRDFEARYTSVLFDLVGSGKSDIGSYNRDKYKTLSGFADDLLEIIDEVSDKPVVFIGHSVSAMIGMIAAVKSPDRFLAQVMVGPSPSYLNDGDYPGGFSRSDIEDLLTTLESNYLGWASDIAPTLLGVSGQPDVAAELVASFSRADPDVAKHFARVTFLSDHRHYLPLLTTPTLIVQSTDDMLVPTPVAEYMQRNIPNSSLTIVENVGHCPHLSAPLGSIDATKAFLGQLSL